MRAFLASWLPGSVKSQLKNIAARINRWRLTCLGSSRWLSVVNSLLGRGFMREQHAVIAGRARFLLRAQQQTPPESDPLLRRNIHRLEKGLLMRPRKVPFALEYIAETVACFLRQQRANEPASDEIRWAADILQQYFAVCAAASKQVAQLALQFEAGWQQPGGQKVPYRYDGLPSLQMHYDDFLLLCQRRRSVRWYLPNPVPKDLLEQAVAAAAQAPSACNRQPFRFLYTLDPTKAAEVAALAVGTAGFAGQLPALMVVVGDLSQFAENRDRHLIYIDAALASMQLMLALDRLGLASCPINWPDIEQNETKMETLLKLEAWERPVMLIATGYADPAGGIAYSQKKSVAQLLVEI
ncbi:MAG: nitroreductase-like protein [Rheinheimera sp.]|nr:MAG: nitroreductase-like protein [Rheinheimera sp.]